MDDKETTEQKNLEPVIATKQNYVPVIMSVFIISIIFLLLGGIIFLWQTLEMNKTKTDFYVQLKSMQSEMDKIKVDKQRDLQQMEKLQKDLQDASSYKNQVIENNKKNVCLDSDGGQDHYVNGSIKYRKYDDMGNVVATGDSSDDCVDTFINGSNKTALREYYCENNQVQYEYFVCPTKCVKGVCLN
jgi:hypothetical protein